MSECNSDVVILVEPKVSSIVADRSCGKLGFEEFVCVEEIGFSGGIWLLWHPCKVQLRVLEHHSQLLHLEGNCGGVENFLLTAIFGKPNMRAHELLWDSIKRILMNVVDPWILAGDFNVLLSMADKRGGVPFNAAVNQPFVDCVHVCGLIDTRMSSKSWRDDYDIPAKLLRLSTMLKKWNKEVFGNVIKRKKDLALKLEKIETWHATNHSGELLAEEGRVRAELERTLAEEEIIWIQKACCKNVLEGRRITLQITLLTRPRDGVWHSHACELG
ncbi:hypothetical protein LINPERHAP2_LOCUS35836 [Linum perenne]